MVGVLHFECIDVAFECAMREPFDSGNGGCRTHSSCGCFMLPCRYIPILLLWPYSLSLYRLSNASPNVFVNSPQVRRCASSTVTSNDDQGCLVFVHRSERVDKVADNHGDHMPTSLTKQKWSLLLPRGRNISCRLQPSTDFPPPHTYRSANITSTTSQLRLPVPEHYHQATCKHQDAFEVQG